MSLGDGPGLRTSIFLKGCPLRCIWCHNPESYRHEAELLFHAGRCTGCGACAAVCSFHTLCEGVHAYDRAKCVNCFRCIASCPLQALERCGKQMNTDEVMKLIRRDKRLCEASGGGVTFTGGEPTAQFSFLLELVRRCKQEGLHVCLETCGFAPEQHLQALVGLVDLFLFDIKETDPVLHKEYTGVDSGPIFSNLRMLDVLGAQLVLRCPIIPGLNDRPSHLEQIGRLADSLASVQEVNLEPYHPLGESKQQALGRKVFSFPPPSEENIAAWLRSVQACTHKPVKLA